LADPKRTALKRWLEAAREVGVLLATFAPLDFAYQFVHKAGQPFDWPALATPIVIGSGGLFLIHLAIKYEVEAGGFDD
jgi:hypothetical protein